MDKITTIDKKIASLTELLEGCMPLDRRQAYATHLLALAQLRTSYVMEECNAEA